MKESLLQFGNSKSLVGIVTEPAALNGNSARPAVILLNAGLIHRVGPSRLYVKIARRLAAQGHLVLRFDLSGIGDSQPRADHLPFEKSVILEVQQAMDGLASARGATHFLLMGHCSGAINSFRTACQDERVVGAVLINLVGGNEEWVAYDRDRKLARYYQHYYRQSALDPQRWRKLLTGKADYRSIARNVFRGMIWNRLMAFGFRLKQALQRRQPDAALPPEAVQARSDLRRLVGRGTQLLLVHSEGSTGLEFLRATLGETVEEVLATKRMKLEIIPQSDHIFTLRRSQQRVLDVITQWVASLLPEAIH